jgi:hypothetical protein
MTSIKGPGIFLAQFMGDVAPFNTLESICKWAASLGFKGVQIPSWDARCIDLKKAAESKTYADEIKGIVASAGMEITELSTHLQGQLIAVHPAYDAQFDGFAPKEVHGNSKARTSEVIPGSHAWDQAQVDAVMARGAAKLLQPVIMPAGGAIVFQGQLLHQGGANRSDASRLAFTNQYCQPWGRTQENFFLGVPQDRVRAMSPRLQRLLGYDIWPPFMGHVTASHPLKALDPDWVPPVVADELKAQT